MRRDWHGIRSGNQAGVSSGRVVVVTGASGGVGRAVARRFAAAGDRVALLARGADGLDAAADDVRAAGGTALALPVDVADAEAVDKAADEVARRWGPIDVWVNNAFVGELAPVTALTSAEVRRITEVTYLGYVHGTMTALRQMMPRDRGTIVHVGSALGYRGIPLQSAYCAAKHAIKGFHESLRCELLHARSGVRTTMVVLPALNTPQFDWVRSTLPRRAQPVPPIFQPEVAATAIVHAANHPRRREYWVGGSTVGTVLANRIAPGLLDRYLARTGFDSQQTDEPDRTARPDNLRAPADDAPGSDHGAHGRFDDQAAGHSVQAWLSRHRGTVAGVGAAVTALTAGLLRRSVTGRVR
jgi:NAD(P)-dependent dehydrogenase (short-subunit alcohol dehydrogenase family)